MHLELEMKNSERQIVTNTRPATWARSGRVHKTNSGGAEHTSPGALIGAPKGTHFIPHRKAGAIVGWYVYAWRGGPRVLKLNGPVRRTLNPREVAAILEKRQKPVERGDRTLAWLIDQWRPTDPSRPSSPEWQKLSAATRKTWGCALNQIMKKWGDVPLELFNDERMTEKVILWRNKRAATPRAADTGVSVLRALLNFGRTFGITKNVAARIGRIYEGGDRAAIVWTEEDITRFVEAAKQLGMPAVGDAVRLAAATGLRRADLIELHPRHITPYAIIKRTRKSRRKKRDATVPRIASLSALLDELGGRPRLPGVETILVDDKGLPWAPDRLTRAVKVIVDAINLVHVDLDHEGGPLTRAKHLHDLRGTFCTKLMIETELTDQQIADIMAWSPEDVARIRRMYVDGATQAIAIGERIERSSQLPGPNGP